MAFDIINFNDLSPEDQDKVHEMQKQMMHIKWCENMPFGKITCTADVEYAAENGLWFDIAYAIWNGGDRELELCSEYFENKKDDYKMESPEKMQGLIHEWWLAKLPRVVLRAMRVLEDYRDHGTLREGDGTAYKKYLHYNAYISGLSVKQAIAEKEIRRGRFKELKRIKEILI